MKLLTCFLAFFLSASLLRGDLSTEEILGKARAYLGGDEVLNELQSIRYEGEFTTAEGATGTIDIIFQKPMQQRIEVVRGDVAEVTALNDFEAWRKTYSIKSPESWSLDFLNVADIRELQANTWENLNFFQGLEERRGWIENEGEVEVKGRQTVKLTFHYPYEILFTRFFDVETGRLVLTETHEGRSIEEEGQIRVKGIVFPETLTMTMDGEIVNQLRFQKISVNEEFEDSLFEVPSMTP